MVTGENVVHFISDEDCTSRPGTGTSCGYSGALRSGGLRAALGSLCEAMPPEGTPRGAPPSDGNVVALCDEDPQFIVQEEGRSGTLLL